jgi:hypothetical protein
MDESKTPEEIAEDREKERRERFMRGYKKGMDAFDRASKATPAAPQFEGKTVPIFEPAKEEA